jgi:PIN domain nuclease of toxin-antitoxin system
MILLDTHAWIWWVSEPSRLSRRARSALDYAARIAVCPISAWELSTKVRMGKIRLDRDVMVWVKQALDRPRLSVAELSPEIAVRAGGLDRNEFHGDPADRLIVATAIELGIELVTKDRRIRDYDPVRTLW